VSLIFDTSRIRGKRHQCRGGGIRDSGCAVIRMPVHGAVNDLLSKSFVSSSAAISRSNFSKEVDVQSTDLCGSKEEARLTTTR
jgi:hypothetical protein